MMVDTNSGCLEYALYAPGGTISYLVGSWYLQLNPKNVEMVHDYFCLNH